MIHTSIQSYRRGNSYETCSLTHIPLFKTLYSHFTNPKTLGRLCVKPTYLIMHIAIFCTHLFADTILAMILKFMIITLASTVCMDSHSVTVRPTDSDRSICKEHTPCDTLSNLISNNPVIFRDRSDLNLTFLKGRHMVNYFGTQIKIEQKRNVIWHGEGAMVVCGTGLSFIFKNNQNLEIYGLNFSKCGSRINSISSEEPALNNYSATLFLNNVEVFRCKAVTIAESKGYGLFLFNHFGNAQISDCSFLNNNVDCKPNFRDHCIGGNIAVYFLTQVHAQEKAVYVSITNSIVEGGGDLSESTSKFAYIRCKDRYKKSSSVSKFRANGLAVIFGQKNYQVQFQVIKTKFSKNTGKHKLPAVVIHDHSEVSNKVEFLNTNFSNGSLVIFRTSKKIMPFEFLRIKNCLFNATYTSAIQICFIPPTKIWLPKHDRKSSFNYSVSLIAIENSMILSEYYHRYWGPPTVMIEGPQKRGTVFWKYNNSEINTAKFSNCKFMSKRGQSSALQIQNSQTVLMNCTFYFFRDTAVNAKNSVIVIHGQVMFNQNRGKQGGALNLCQSLMFIRPSGRTLFVKNNASFGGGLFATPVDTDFNQTDVGLYSFCTVVESATSSIVFEKNKARFGGNSIFGGKFSTCSYNCTGKYQCQVMPNTSKGNGQQFPQNLRIIPYSNDSKTEVSSPANRICLCRNNKPTSTCNKVKRIAFPGQEFNISQDTKTFPKCYVGRNGK